MKVKKKCSVVSPFNCFIVISNYICLRAGS